MASAATPPSLSASLSSSSESTFFAASAFVHSHDSDSLNSAPRFLLCARPFLTDVVTEFRRAAAEDTPIAVVAIRVLTAVIQRSGASTMTGLLSELELGTTLLKQSVRAECLGITTQHCSSNLAPA